MSLDRAKTAFSVLGSHAESLRAVVVGRSQLAGLGGAVAPHMCSWYWLLTSDRLRLRWRLAINVDEFEGYAFEYRDHNRSKDSNFQHSIEGSFICFVVFCFFFFKHFYEVTRKKRELASKTSMNAFVFQIHLKYI